MIARDSLPISTVENEGFRNLIQYLEPSYDIPSRKTMTSYLQGLFKAKKEGLKSELSEVDDVALTIDCWTSCTQEGYMTVTAHYMKDTKFQSKVIDTRPVAPIPD